MSIKNTGSFSGGGLSAPDLSTTIRAFQGVSDQIAADKRAAQDAAYKGEVLGMQKAEHQMKVDDRAAKDAMTLGLMKPKELSNAASLTDIVPAADVEKMAVLPTDTPAQVAEKERLQSDLGKFSQTMASNPKYLETQAEYLQRVGSTMGGKVPLEMAVMMNTARDAETVAKAAALDKNEQAMRAAEKEHLQFGLDAIKTMRGTSSRSGSKDANGDGIVDSTELAATKQLLKLTDEQRKSEAEGLKAINESFADKKYAGKNISDAKNGTIKIYNENVAKGVDPLLAAQGALAGVKVDNNWILPDKVSVGATGDTDIGQAMARSIALGKEQRAQIGSLLGATNTVADSDVRNQVSKLSSLMDKGKARLEEEKKLIEMSPQERTQYSLLKDLQGKGVVDKPEVLKVQQENQQRTAALQQSPEELEYTQKYGVKPPKGYYDKVPDKWRTKIDVSEKQLTDIVNQMPADVRNHPLAKDIALAAAAESSGNGQLLGDGKTSAGLLQWRNERQTDALNWVNKQQGTGKKYDKLADVPNEWQYRYALHDMTEGGYRDLGKTLSGVTSPAERARLISDHYEVPAYGYHEGKIRGEAAVKYDATLDRLLKPAGSKTPEVTMEKSKDEYTLQALSDAADKAAKLKTDVKPIETLLKKPARGWSEEDLKTASVLPAIPKDKKNYDAADMLLSTFGKTPMTEHPAKVKALRILADRKEDSKANAGDVEEGLVHSNMDVLMVPGVGKILPKSTPKGKVTQYEVPIGPNTPPRTVPANTILRSPEELLAAEARRKKLMGGSQYDFPIGPRPVGLQ